MRQGNTSIEDHVAKFKILLADSRVTEDSHRPGLLSEIHPSPALKKNSGPGQRTGDPTRMVQESLES